MDKEIFKGIIIEPRNIKYIDVRFHWIQNVLEKHRMQLVKINTNRKQSNMTIEAAIKREV